MPKKKTKGTGKKKGKKGSKSKSTVLVKPGNPFVTNEIPSPLKPGERLIKLLTTHPADVRDIHGVKVSTRILEQMTPQEVRDLRAVFEIFDTDSDGLLAAPELKKAMRTLGFKLSREEAQQVISDVSMKGRTSLDFNEFLETVIARQGDTRDVYDEILQGFKMFDYDSTGHVSMENLRQACQESGIKFTQKELEEMVEEADINGDGHVDQSEFIRIMLQTNLF
ncbi:uncharacterized protein [Littorina saxatilis]|uniref:EF-hand domain-containing protein n=1 Tax=Littorina saxatilis TaxID=31220 RepID=A0AAN9AUL7_9CAEN|eukprot:GHVL01015474.1.p1 GENE.GHVL01015474.1~~GHVL01015474.1.p1  ORF type:complete len:223 (+),score=31.73 GHVL01015474.1:195-863(+)